MDNIYARWFSGFTIIVCLVLVGRKLVRCNSIIFDTIMHCEKDTTADGLLMGICDDAYGENLPDFTKLGLGKVQVLHVVNAEDFQLRRRIFDDYNETLIELRLKRLLRYPKDRGRYTSLDQFYNLKKLLTFEFSGSSLHDIDNWQYPENLLSLILDNNKYKQITIDNLANLQKLSVNDNFFDDLPKFHNPPPPILSLSLKRNNLGKFSVARLAPLCELEKLELENRDSDFFKPDAACNCRNVQMWMQEFSIAGSNFSCGQPTQECDRKEWEDAMRFYSEVCPSPLERFLLRKYKFIIGFALSFLFLIMISSCLMYGSIEKKRSHETEETDESPNGEAEAKEEEDEEAD